MTKLKESLIKNLLNLIRAQNLKDEPAFTLAYSNLVHVLNEPSSSEIDLSEEFLIIIYFVDKLLEAKNLKTISSIIKDKNIFFHLGVPIFENEVLADIFSLCRINQIEIVANRYLDFLQIENYVYHEKRWISGYHLNRGNSFLIGKTLAANVVRIWIEDAVDNDTGEVCSVECREIVFNRDTLITDDILKEIPSTGSLYVSIYDSIKQEEFNELLEQYNSSSIVDFLNNIVRKIIFSYVYINEEFRELILKKISENDTRLVLQSYRLYNLGYQLWTNGEINFLIKKLVENNNIEDVKKFIEHLEPENSWDKNFYWMHLYGVLIVNNNFSQLKKIINEKINNKNIYNTLCLTYFLATKNYSWVLSNEDLIEV